MTVVAPHWIRDIVQPLVIKAGSQHAAATESGISQGQLSKMLRQTMRYQLSEAVVQRLFKWIPKTEWPKLETSLLWGSESDLITRHHNWMVSRTGRGFLRRGVSKAVIPLGKVLERARHRERMVELVKPYFPSLFAWFDNKLDAAKASQIRLVES